jgi:hypothetical protein
LVVAVPRNRNAKDGWAFEIIQRHSNSGNQGKASDNRYENETAHLNLSASFAGLRTLT